MNVTPPHEAEGGLRFDVAGAIREGGDSGPLAEPGKPESSLLVSAIRYEDLEMPPDAPLSASEQADIVKWIELGAYWPVIGKAKHESDASDDGAM